MIVDPANSFCDEAVCYAGQEEIAYYFDDDHMSVAGAGIVADEILTKLGFPVGSDRRRGGAESLAYSGRASFEAVAVGGLELVAWPAQRRTTRAMIRLAVWRMVASSSFCSRASSRTGTRMRRS